LTIDVELSKLLGHEREASPSLGLEILECDMIARCSSRERNTVCLSRCGLGRENDDGDGDETEVGRISGDWELSSLNKVSPASI
jgi:hypothetical protein